MEGRRTVGRQAGKAANPGQGKAVQVRQNAA